LDEARHAAWVRGGDDPTQKQIFRVSIGQIAAAPEQITRTPGIHEAEFAENGGVWGHTTRRMDVMPAFEVRGRADESGGHLASFAETPRIQLHASFETAGPHEARALMLRPKDFRQGVRYPVIVSVYGGPTSQTVLQSLQDHLLQQWFADHGFIVVSIDG